MEQLAPDTSSYLRPHQVANFESEIKSLERKLVDPHIQDKGEVRKQLIRTRQGLATQRPQPPESGDEAGKLEKRAQELLADIMPSMCSAEEMRKAPDGAVSKFRSGEGSPTIKKKIIEYRNIQRRLYPEDAEAGSIERFRPRTNTLNMGSAQVPGKQFYIPENVGPVVTFSEEEVTALRTAQPSLADSLGLLSNEQRAVVKSLVGALVAQQGGKKERQPSGPTARERLGA